ncbi:MAG: hypothetical protein QHH07_07185, partial [Sedimentisphaerales bacterium]|nr:hypothetical protein [Sedimentisphaerales bacterium]
MSAAGKGVMKAFDRSGGTLDNSLRPSALAFWIVVGLLAASTYSRDARSDIWDPSRYIDINEITPGMEG